MKNPYEVLGVSQTATDEEIKTAYRNLAKKYHPDNYNDSPLADVAEEKMKEVNEAYDAICDMRKNGSSGSYSQGSYGTSGAYTRTSYPDVRTYIQTGRLDDAEAILNGVSPDSRNAEWYFLMGMIYSRRGFSEQAYTYFTRAYQMEPNNMEFKAAFDNMNHRRSYQNPGYATSDYSGCSACDICTGLMCADCLCSCCGSGGRMCC